MKNRSAALAWWWIAVAILAAAAVRFAIGPVIVDDAYITFRYARAIALSGAFEYNPGERVLGTTTPLFTMLMTVSFWRGWPPEWTAVAISCLADGLTIATLAALLLSWGQRIAVALTIAMLAMWPVMITYAVSGLETSLYTFLVYGCFFAASRGRAAGSGVLLGLALLCRPDAALCALVLLVYFARTPRKLVFVAAAAAAVTLPWAVFAAWYFGSVVPQSIVAKAAIEQEPWTGVRVLLAFFGGSPKYLALSAAAAAGAAILWTRAHASARLVLSWAVVYTAVFTATNAFSQFPWYFVPLFPIYFAAAATCGGALIERGRWTVTALAGPALMTALLILGAWHLRGHESFLRGLAAGREQLYARAASRIGAEATPTTVIAATEIGTIGYFYPGPVLDLMGLVSPEAVGHPMLDAMIAGNAEWLVTYDTHFDRDVAASARFTEAYVLVSRSSVGPSRALEVYRRRGGPRAESRQLR